MNNPIFFHHALRVFIVMSHQCLPFEFFKAKLGTDSMAADHDSMALSLKTFTPSQHEGRCMPMHFYLLHQQTYTPYFRDIVEEVPSQGTLHNIVCFCSSWHRKLHAQETFGCHEIWIVILGAGTFQPLSQGPLESHQGTSNCLRMRSESW